MPFDPGRALVVHRIGHEATSTEPRASERVDVPDQAFAKVYVQWSRGDVRDIGSYLRRAVTNEANSKLRRRYLERSVAQRRSGDDRGVRMIDDGAADRDQVWQAI